MSRSLISQYDARTIPEQTTSIPPFSLEDKQKNNTIDISIPIFPSSQFWISFSCPQPDDDEEPSVPYYYFKLFAAGACILSWSVGEDENYCGKVVHGLYATGTDFDGRRIVERRAFFFSNDGPEGCQGGFEIRVFRAKGRKRQATKYDKLRDVNVVGTGVDLNNTGRVKSGERPRQYTYALIDLKDEPYVTFRYSFEAALEATEDTAELPGRSPCPDSTMHAETVELSAQRRLSIPPSVKLNSTTSLSEPWSPIKRPASRDARAEEDHVDADEIKRHEWVFRTQSPMVSSLFERPSSLSSGRRGMGLETLLKAVVDSALKRKEEQKDSLA